MILNEWIFEDKEGTYLPRSEKCPLQKTVKIDNKSAASLVSKDKLVAFIPLGRRRKDKDSDVFVQHLVWVNPAWYEYLQNFKLMRMSRYIDSLNRADFDYVKLTKSSVEKSVTNCDMKQFATDSDLVVTIVCKISDNRYVVHEPNSSSDFIIEFKGRVRPGDEIRLNVKDADNGSQSLVVAQDAVISDNYPVGTVLSDLTINGEDANNLYLQLEPGISVSLKKGLFFDQAHYKDDYQIGKVLKSVEITKISDRWINGKIVVNPTAMTNKVFHGIIVKHLPSKNEKYAYSGFFVAIAPGTEVYISGSDAAIYEQRLISTVQKHNQTGNFATDLNVGTAVFVKVKSFQETEKGIRYQCELQLDPKLVEITQQRKTTYSYTNLGKDHVGSNGSKQSGKNTIHTSVTNTAPGNAYGEKHRTTTANVRNQSPANNSRPTASVKKAEQKSSQKKINFLEDFFTRPLPKPIGKKRVFRIFVNDFVFYTLACVYALLWAFTTYLTGQFFLWVMNFIPETLLSFLLWLLVTSVVLSTIGGLFVGLYWEIFTE
jgi:hypothetical protein